MADSPQYVIKVKFEVFMAGEEDGVPGLEQSFVMRNLNAPELLAVDGELLKFYTGFMTSLKELAATEGMYLDKD